MGAGAELERLADLMAAPIVKPLLGKVVVPDGIHMAEGLAKGQLNRGRIVLTLFRDKGHDFKGSCCSERSMTNRAFIVTADARLVLGATSGMSSERRR
jgi:hypothetical protein